MKENENVVSGYNFSDHTEYEEALKEAETIKYLKANNDLTDHKTALRLYHKLVDKRAFNTAVGFSFLEELRNNIIKEGIVGCENIPGIPVGRIGMEFFKKKAGLSNQDSDQYRILSREYQIRHRNSRIINVFLVLVIIGMIIISIKNGNSLFHNKEKEILNKYSAWEEELDAREKQLQQKEVEAGK